MIEVTEEEFLHDFDEYIEAAGGEPVLIVGDTHDEDVVLVSIKEFDGYQALEEKLKQLREIAVESGTPIVTSQQK
jgi:PHD/YefM family antitoxin component YafN of YafNO toxin-antitoxin module